MDEADVFLSQCVLVCLCKIPSQARFAVQRKSKVKSTLYDSYMGYRSAKVWHFIDMPVIQMYSEAFQCIWVFPLQLLYSQKRCKSQIFSIPQG